MLPTNSATYFSPWWVPGAPFRQCQRPLMHPVMLPPAAPASKQTRLRVIGGSVYPPLRLLFLPGPFIQPQEHLVREVVGIKSYASNWWADKRCDEFFWSEVSWDWGLCKNKQKIRTLTTAQDSCHSKSLPLTLTWCN